MSENVIEQAADELARVTTSPRSYCVLLAEALADAGLLRPVIDEAMIERAASVMAEVTGEPRIGRFERTMTKVLLEAALGGEQND